MTTKPRKAVEKKPFGHVGEVRVDQVVPPAQGGEAIGRCSCGKTFVMTYERDRFMEDARNAVRDRLAVHIDQSGDSDG
jgi:hypothetical protein